jgi:F-type H+-transporting ATPase subunit alpha
VEVFKQPAYSPIPVEIQVGIMWAVQNDFFDSIAPEKVSGAVSSLKEYLAASGKSVVSTILKEKSISDTTEADLRKAVEDWKRGFAG